MKLKYTFEMMEMDDQVVAVPVGDGVDALHGIIKLNSSAAAIFEQLKSETTVDEVINALDKRFDNSREEISDFVVEYIEELRKAGFLE